ncbi:MAG: T9SS type A sorting domain-containing protein [Fluviicola sp.]|nr:T9SS type A sorting domain-containing protein [Fluviicola sp.]
MNNLKIIANFWLLLMLVYNTNLYAQIVYTDIPDATPNATFPLDLNNDSIVDFMLHFGGSGSAIGAYCTPQNNNAYSGNTVNGDYFPWALAASTTICDTLATWYNVNFPGTMGLGTSTGYWPGQTDKYLALQLIVGTNTYYGWVRLDVYATSSSFTVKDYAYESTPNACIVTGEIPLGITENATENFLSIAPNPFHDATTIQTSGDFSSGVLTIYDLFGKTFINQVMSSNETFTLSREQLPSGFYYVSLTAKNNVIAIEKLVLID